MSKFEFEPEDFDVFMAGIKGAKIHLDWLRGIAERANEVLREHLDSLPVVYGRNATGHAFDSAGPASNDTHKAVLFNVEPIEKKCMHEITTIFFGDSIHGLCRHCNKAIKLSGTWSVE